jgi:hypothetical protein
MRAKNRIHLYKLPNHSWLPGDWFPVGSKHDHPETVVRRLGARVLVREHKWSEIRTGLRFDYSKEFCGENHPNETWKARDLGIYSNAAIGILAQRADDGDANAALELALLAIVATKRLTKICKNNPELLHPLSRFERGWPIVKMKREKLSESEKELFDRLKLGVDDFVENDTSAKWRLDDAGIIAHSLLSYIRVSRGSLPHGFDNGKITKYIVKKLPYEFDDDEENRAAWWEVAEEILLYSYPNPCAIPELNNLVTTASKRKSPGRLKQAILRKLKSRFMAFAPS